MRNVSPAGFRDDKKGSAFFSPMIAPYYAAKKNCSRGTKHGETIGKSKLRQEQPSKWASNRSYRKTMLTANHSPCRYLDAISKIAFSDTATYQQRLRYKNTISLVSNDHYQACTMQNRSDYKSTTRALTSIQIREGRKKTFIPKHARSRRRPIDEQLRGNLEWQSQNWRSAWSAWSQPSLSSSTTPTRSWQEQDHQTGGHI